MLGTSGAPHAALAAADEKGRHAPQTTISAEPALEPMDNDDDVAHAARSLACRLIVNCDARPVKTQMLAAAATAVRRAAEIYGHIEGLRAAADPQANLRELVMTDARQRTAMHLAAGNGHTDAIARMIQAAADPQALLILTDDQMKTALHLAAENGHCQATIFMRGAAADKRDLLEMKDQAEQTALQLALQNGYGEAFSNITPGHFLAVAVMVWAASQRQLLLLVGEVVQFILSLKIENSPWQIPADSPRSPQIPTDSRMFLLHAWAECAAMSV